jgi:GNAT superfamily N-acetyltransferase
LTTKIKQGNWQDFSRKVQGRLRVLNYRDGAMRDELEKINVSNGPHKIFVAMAEDGLPRAWALVIYSDKRYQRYDIMLYTARQWRRMGYGRRLYRRAAYWVKMQGCSQRIFECNDNREFFRAMKRGAR